MKKNKFLLALVVMVLSSGAAHAQSTKSLERDLSNLREDFEIMQKKIYEGGGSAGASALVKTGELEESIRGFNGRMDEIEHKVKQLNDRIDMLNKDMDVRFKMLEGKPVNGSEPSTATRNSFDAPVAVGAPTAVTGESVNRGSELEPVSAKEVQDVYQKGLEDLKASKYDDAEKSFSSILANHPNDALAGNAQYWLGEVYYGKKDYTRAAVSFGKGYQSYKASPKGADSLLKLGMSMKALNKKPEACAAFTSMNSEFPNAVKEVKDKAKDQAKALGCK